MQSLLFELFDACVLCGRKENLTVDHLRPLAAGWGLQPGNVVVLCQSCNSSKKDRRIHHWQRKEEDLIRLLRAAARFQRIWMEDPYSVWIYFGGTFDLGPHSGHLYLLEEAVKKVESEYGFLCARTFISLNSSSFNERYKGKPPILTLGERYAMMSACKFVDVVGVNFGDEDSKPAILEADVDYIAHGKDWTGDSLARQMGLSDEFMREHGIDFLYVELARYDDGSKVSTSEIKRRVIEQHEE